METIDSESQQQQFDQSDRVIVINEDENIVHDHIISCNISEEDSSTKTQLRFVSRLHLAHFLDLIYVAGIYNINHLYDKCGSSDYEIVQLVVGIFLIIYLTRHHFDVYSIMFYSSDMFHKFIFMTLNLSVFFMAMNIDFSKQNASHRRSLFEFDDDNTMDYDINNNAAANKTSINEGVDDFYFDDATDDVFTIGSEKCSYHKSYSIGFATGYLFSRVVLISMYGLVGYSAYLLKQYDHMKTYLMKIFPLFCGSILILPIFDQRTSPAKLFIFVAITEIIFEIIPELILFFVHRKYFGIDNFFECLNFQGTIRPHEEELADRLQEFFLIVSGEAIIGLLTFSNTTTKLKKLYVCMAFSCTMIYSVLAHFLATVHRSTEQKHAMTKDFTIHRLIFIWLHPALCLALLITYNALTQLNKYVGAKDTPNNPKADRLRMILSAGLAIIVLIMIIMRLMHKGITKHLNKFSSLIHLLFKLVVAAIHFTFYYYITSNISIVIAHSMLATGTNTIEMILFPYVKKETDLNIIGVHKEVHTDHKYFDSHKSGHHSISRSNHTNTHTTKSNNRNSSNRYNQSINNSSNHSVNSNDKSDRDSKSTVSLSYSKKTIVSHLSAVSSSSENYIQVENNENEAVD